MNNKSKNVVFSISILALIFISNVLGNASIITGQPVAPEFNPRGDLTYIYKNSKEKFILETINIKTNELSAKTIPLPTNAFSPVIKKDRYGRIWIIWEERAYDNSRLLLGMLEDGMITCSQIISNRAGFNYSPDLYFDVDNIPWAVWINYQNAKYCIFVQEVTSRRTWEIKSSSFSVFSSPKIIVDHNNQVWVFWSGKEADERGIFYRILNHYMWSPQKKIQQGNNFPHVSPDVTIDSKGFIWLVWSGYDGSDYEIYCSFWDGINWSEKIKITENDYKSDISPSISTVAGKVPIITWAQSGPRESQVYFAFLENNIWSGRLKISLAGNQNRFPRMVVDGEKIGIVWQSGDEVQAKVAYFNQLKDRHYLYCPDSPSQIFSITLLDENKFIGFGDSITYGTFYHGPDPEKGYIPRLENLLNQHYGDQKVVNEGKGGEITAEGLARIENVISKNAAKYLLLMEGTNDIDIDLGLLIDTIAFNLREMVQKCLDYSLFPAIASIIPQRGNFWELHRDRTYELNQKIEQIAEDLSIPFVDQFDTFYNYPEEKGGFESLFSYPDQVHPNETGYQLIAEKWFEEIKNFLSSPSHSVSTPDTPEGQSIGKTNTSYAYTTGGSVCSQNHSVKYRFEWGDGTNSNWSSSTAAYHSWETAGIYTVKAQARCSVDNHVVSDWSSGKIVTIIPRISGSVKTARGEGIEGVTITFSKEGGTVTTDLNGNYSQTVPYGWSGTAIPLKTHYTFIPSSRSYSKVTNDELNHNYVGSRIIYAPLNFTGQKVLNRSLSQAEYINVLNWEANPKSENIEKYRIYEVEGETKSLLVELYADTFEYWHRRVDKDKQYTYAICAVNDEGREGRFVYVEID